MFAKIGDSITASPDFLSDIGCFAENLGDYTSLQDTISFYRQKKLALWLSTAWCRTSNPFNVDSVAALPGWRASYALNPDRLSPRYQGYCNIDNITPLDCELQLMKPSVVLIMYGTNDIAYNDVENFAGSLNYIVLTCLSRGVIPVVSTIPPRLDDPTKGARVERFNSAIITIARNNRIPIWNYWLALQAPEIINYGLSADGVHPSVYQSTRSADFRPEALRYGYNQRNLTALQVLDHIRNVVMLDGPADP